jgi:hypothetical protein
VTPCSVVVGYQSLGGSSCRWGQHGPLKRWYPTTILHGVTTQKTSTWNITAVKASNLAWVVYVYIQRFEKQSENHAMSLLVDLYRSVKTILKWRYNSTHSPRYLMKVSSQLHALPLYLRRRGLWNPLIPRAGLDTMTRRKIPSSCQESNSTGGKAAGAWGWPLISM